MFDCLRPSYLLLMSHRSIDEKFDRLRPAEVIDKKFEAKRGVGAKLAKSKPVCAGMVLRSWRHLVRSPQIFATLQDTTRSPRIHGNARNRPPWALADSSLMFELDGKDFTHPGKPDETLRKAGFDVVYIGVDEAGAGPIAGPLLAGAFWMAHRVRHLPGVRDSKQIKAKKKRKKLEDGDDDEINMDRSEMKTVYDALTENKDYEWAIAEISASDLDKKFDGNPLKARMAAMTMAVRKLQDKVKARIPQGRAPYWKILVDGTHVPKDLKSTVTALFPFVRGDDRICEISAASILAKWTRDRIMVEYHRRYPQYGFDSNVGYGSDVKHIQAIYDHGICPIHRRKFEPIETLIATPNKGKAQLKAYIEKRTKRRRIA